MLVAVPGVGILLRDCQPDGILWAVVDTGQAGLAVPGDVDCPSILYTNGCRWADHLADSTANASIGHPNEMMPGI